MLGVMTKSQAQPPFGLDPEAMTVATQALDAALLRCRAASGSDLFAPAVEAVWWLCALDEQLGRPSQSVSAQQPWPQEAGAEVIAARTAHGLRWVRDCHSHQLPLTTRQEVIEYDDPRRGLGLRGVHVYVAWKPADEIRSDPTKESASARAAYEQSVAGGECLSVLDTAAAFVRDRLAKVAG